MLFKQEHESLEQPPERQKLDAAASDYQCIFGFSY